MPKRYKYVNTRRYARLYSPHMIRYKVVELTSTMPIDKVEKGGISFISKTKPPISSTVELEISSPSLSQSIKATARIVKVEPKGMLNTYKLFAQFVAIEDGDRDALSKISDTATLDAKKILELSPEYFSITHKALGSDESTTTVTKDISAGGMALLSNKPMEAASLIEIEINFPATSHPIKTIAKVLRSIPQEGKYRISCEFVKIDDKDKLAIDDYINKITDSKRERKWWWRTLK